jgi:hypothetical protein
MAPSDAAGFDAAAGPGELAEPALFAARASARCFVRHDDTSCPELAQ